MQLAELSQVYEVLRAAHEALAKKQAARDANDTSREPGLRSGRLPPTSSAGY